MILWRFFGRFLRHRRPLLLGFVCVPLAALLDVRITVMIGDALDRLKQGDDTSFLRGLFWILLLYALVRGLFRFATRWWVVVVSRRVEVELKQDLFDKLVSLPLSFHARSLTGDIASRLTSDVENVRMFLGPGAMYVSGALVMLPAALWTLLRLDAGLAGMMFVPLVLMGIGIAALMPTSHRRSTEVQERQADLAHRAQESFGGIRVIKGYGLEGPTAERFEAASAKNMRAQVSFGRARGLSHAITETSHSLSFLPILLVGGLGLIDRSIAVGHLFQFIDLSMKVFWPVIALGWMAGLYPRALASAERIDGILRTVPDIADPPQPTTIERVQGALSLADVSFTYPGAREPALHGVTLAVPAGSVLGVVGPTASGKSTLLNALGRLVDVDGEIRLDGVPIRRLSLSQLRTSLGYVPQDSFLFSETFRENLEFGADGPLGEPRLRELVEAAALTSEVERFPDGLEQLIGERGVTLSGGQRQRACIARALARDPRVLVLDDCLSAVDTETEQTLLASLHSAAQGRTLVVAAHRLSTVRRADQIAVLQRGRVEALGSHEELLRSSAWYRETWTRQQAQEELEVL